MFSSQSNPQVLHHLPSHPIPIDNRFRSSAFRLALACYLGVEPELSDPLGLVVVPDHDLVVAEAGELATADNGEEVAPEEHLHQPNAAHHAQRIVAGGRRDAEAATQLKEGVRSSSWKQ